ncbi:MAG: lipopolysaccharide biosynthesis protein [Niastella sp.]|uniref:lipopolysaccharide biosynthesis protein n=1 Tax=Niastella sp. TaxID=1869183 RepID=UPI00389A13B9
MKKIALQLNHHPRYAKLLKWSRLVSISAIAQTLLQTMSFIGGVFVIRLLPTHEYALYTLANTMLATMILLADSGVSTGVMAQAAKVWDDNDKLGAVLATGFELRKKFALVSLLIALPALLFLFFRHGYSWSMSALIFVSLVPAFVAGLSGTLLEVVFKLRQDIIPLQKVQVLNNLGRLVLIAGMLTIFPWAFIAILAAGIPQLWANRRLKESSMAHVNWQQEPDPLVRKEILFIVKRALPGAVYYCLSGQITIWLISLFGNDTAIAQMGALGRLAMALSIFSVLFSTLVSPRFARLPSSKEVLLKLFINIMSCLLLLTILIICFTWLFPAEMLWILGKNYSGLNRELLLYVTDSCLGLLWGSAYILGATRGWNIHPGFSITVSICAIVAGIVLIDVSTVKGVLLLNLFVSIIQVLMYGSYTLLKIIKMGPQKP